MTEELWQVTLDYATYGLVTEGGRVVDAPPIAKWAIYKPIEYVKEWVRGKGGRVERVDKNCIACGRSLSSHSHADALECLRRLGLLGARYE